MRTRKAHVVYANARGARGMDRPKLGPRHLLPQVSQQPMYRQSTYMDPGSTRDFDPSGTGCGGREGAGDCGRDDGTAEIVDLPEAVEPLVEYFRSVAGEHPDWDEYREAMVRQGKCLIRVTIDAWGPIATGGFPPEAGR